MLDYNMMINARNEHEERVRRLQLEYAAGVSVPGPIKRGLFGLGTLLVNAGSRLKQHNQPLPDDLLLQHGQRNARGFASTRRRRYDNG